MPAEDPALPVWAEHQDDATGSPCMVNPWAAARTLRLEVTPSLTPAYVGLQSLALEPDYGVKKTRELVYGGVGGQLTLVSRVSD